MTLIFPQETEAFFNNVSCKPFVKIIQQTLLDRLKTGAVSLLGKVGEVHPPPHLPSRSPLDRGTNEATFVS